MRILPSELSATDTVGSGVGVGFAVAGGADEDAPPHAVARTIATSNRDRMRMTTLPDEVVMSGTALARDRMSRRRQIARSHMCDPIDGPMRSTHPRSAHALASGI